MPARDLVLLAIIDLVAVLGVAAYVTRVLRRGSAPPTPVPRAGVLLMAAAAMLFLVALPFPWARATGGIGHRLATLTASPASSLVGFAAIVLSVAALGMGAGIGRHGESLVVALTGVVLGAGWCLVALDSLLLTYGVNHGAGGRGHLAGGAALWLCLLAGLVAMAAGAMATRDFAPVASAAPTPPRVPANVDEWGIAGLSAPHQAGDQW